jgi:hypothetical protein
VAFEKYVISKFYIANDTVRRKNIFLFVSHYPRDGYSVCAFANLEKERSKEICAPSAAKTSNA